jgi:hypothetical protein
MASAKGKGFSLARFARAHRVHRERKVPRCCRMVLKLILSRVFSANPAGSAREKVFHFLFFDFPIADNFLPKPSTSVTILRNRKARGRKTVKAFTPHSSPLTPYEFLDGGKANG